MHERASKLLLTHLAAVPGGRTLIVGLWGTAVADALTGRGEDVVTFHTDARAAREARGDVRFGAWLDEAASFDVAIVAAPKEAERLRMWLAMARGSVRDGGAVVVVGHNDTGIRAAGKHVRALVGDPEVLAYGSHSRAFRARATVEPAATALEDWAETIVEEVAGERLTIRSYPGTFAHGRVDDATRLLLETIPFEPGRRALDVGSGAGVIAARLARAGLTVDAVDADALAVRATTETLALNGAEGRAWASDVYADVVGRYDTIASNPPFHAGVRTITDVAEAVIRGARDRLEPGGALWLVSNSFLPYREALARALRVVDVVADDGRYRVYRASFDRTPRV